MSINRLTGFTSLNTPDPSLGEGEAKIGGLWIAETTELFQGEVITLRCALSSEEMPIDVISVEPKALRVRSGNASFTLVPTKGSRIVTSKNSIYLK